LYVLQLATGEEVVRLADAFVKRLQEYFPRAVTDSPVQLSISISNAKYPYGEHWQFLTTPARTLNVQYPARKSRLEIEVEQFEELKRNVELRNRRVSTFLHNLAAIEQRTGSRILTQVELLDARNKYPQVVDLCISKGFSARQILDYFKIISIRGGTVQEDLTNEMQAMEVR
jgi:hypothetical protein